MDIVFRNFIQEQALPSFEEICELVSSQQDNLVVDGVKAFNPKSQFVEGKVINAFSYLIISKKDTLEISDLCAQLKKTFHFVAGRNFETWGILNCLTGMYRLQKNHLLENSIFPADLEALKRKLDWHQFIDENDHFRLIGKPTNYYGVAFGISRYLELLGWSNKQYSDIFFDLLMRHINTYSGDNMVMDETEGQGRFDRYSLLIPAEISNLLVETKRPVPDILMKMLSRSAEVCLMIANNGGNGIAYGRSIGAYGDTAVLEILSIANRLGLLNNDNKQLGFEFSKRIIKKYQTFWFDRQTKQVNMWDKGRQTDGYRNKNRILGETLSLQLQILHSIENFEMNPLEIERKKSFSDLLHALPKYKEYIFDKQDGVKKLIIVRQNDRVYMVPFINGGAKYFKTSPYLPMPMSTELIEFTPDRLSGYLIPLLTIEGKEFMPISDFSSVTLVKGTTQSRIQFRLSKLCSLEEDNPTYRENIQYNGSYSFIGNSLAISGQVKLCDNTRIDKVRIEVPLFDSVSRIENGRVMYSGKNINNIGFTGFDEIKLSSNLQNYKTPHGAHHSLVVAESVINADNYSFEIAIEF
ncbi:hypothetical protein [Lapidilactobacillus bayanensis]|uniref:hypothetical protein n=1 Tax=Lapidilactobacillus bayanensis TaxID=2485998 RepID=UPI000F7B6BF7|nr:hypothetical protein [Lapidilactobacillus bayanensis]